jgi:polyisoprenoid-binding protein YceI
MIKRLSLALAALLAGTAVHAQSAGTYAVDPSHTFVTWEALHFGTSTVRGRFDKKEGTVQFDRAAKTGKVELTIDTSSLSTGLAPFAKFVSDKFAFSGDKVSEVSGTLTLLGKTGPVVLKASNFNCYTNPMLKREVCGGDFETTIQRSQWGMSYGLPGIPDNIKLLVQVEAIKQ